MSSKAVRTLYRLFLRQARDLERRGIAQLDIRMPVSKGAPAPPDLLAPPLPLPLSPPPPGAAECCPAPTCHCQA